MCLYLLSKYPVVCFKSMNSKFFYFSFSFGLLGSMYIHMYILIRELRIGRGCHRPITIHIFKLLTLMLLVANLANAKLCKKYEKWLKAWHMGTHLRELSKSFPMSTNKTGLRWVKIFASLYFGRKKPQHWKG